jgi:FKBP-type peptidyl-prolyl cis-trans isomerase
MAPVAASDPIEEYFKNLREKENVQRTPSGLHYRITDEGYGNPPADDATVVISYAARLPDGESLPALSRARVRTAMADLLPGMREGLHLLRRGGKALIYLPPALSFGNGEWPAGVPRGAPVIFFLELHDITAAK